jgi:hypothetical protein
MAHNRAGDYVWHTIGWLLLLLLLLAKLQVGQAFIEARQTARSHACVKHGHAG